MKESLMIDERRLIKIDKKICKIEDNYYYDTSRLASVFQYSMFFISTFIMSGISIFIMIYFHDIFTGELSNKPFWANFLFSFFFFIFSVSNTVLFVDTIKDKDDPFFKKHFLGFIDTLNTIHAQLIMLTAFGVMGSVALTLCFVGVSFFITINQIYLVNALIIISIVFFAYSFIYGFKAAGQKITKDKKNPIFLDEEHHAVFIKNKEKLQKEKDALLDETFNMVKDVNDYLLLKHIAKKEKLSHVNEIASKLESKLVRSSEYNDFKTLEKETLMLRSSEHKLTIRNV